MNGSGVVKSTLEVDFTMSASSSVDWSLLITLLGVVVSAIAIYRADQTARRSEAIDKRLLAIEKERDKLAKKARMAYNLAKDTSAQGRQYIEIRNIGQAEARNITVHLDGRQVANHPLNGKFLLPMFTSIDDDGRVYPRTLHPASEPLRISIADPVPPNHKHVKVTVMWEDDSMDRGKSETELRLI